MQGAGMPIGYTQFTAVWVTCVKNYSARLFKEIIIYSFFFFLSEIIHSRPNFKDAGPMATDWERKMD